MIADTPQFVEQVKKRFETLLNQETGWIHFDGYLHTVHFKIPVVENLSYLIIMMMTHRQEMVDQAFHRLDRLFYYYRFDEGFSETLHDLPEVKSYSSQLIAFHLLKLIDAKYIKYTSSSIKERFSKVLSNLMSVIEKCSIEAVKNKVDAINLGIAQAEKMTPWDLGECLLFRDKQDPLLSWYHAHTGTTLLPKDDHRMDGSAWELTPFHLLALFALKRLDVASLPLNLLRYLPFLKPHHFELASDCHPGLSALEVNFPKPMVIFPHGLSLMVQSEHPVKWEHTPGKLMLQVQYPSSPISERESSCETIIYLTKSPLWHLTVDDQRQTTFELDQEVRCSDQQGQRVLSIRIKATGGRFLGTIGFQNRFNQKRKTFQAFDQMVGIRTVKRDANAEVSIEIPYDSLWNRMG
jgi:hypothetical protein